MQFSVERIRRLKRSLELALNQELPQLTFTRKRLAPLSPTVIQPIPAHRHFPDIVATVATDGGENRLSLDPIQVQVIRVADSTGEIFFEDFVAQSLEPEEILRFFFQSNSRLHKFLNYLSVEWSDLLPGSDLQRSNLLSMLRELMEWASLLKLASQPPRKLLIRDGLLRSILLSETVFGRLREKFEQLCDRHGHLLAGVAKRSRVVNYLSLSLDLGEVFKSNLPAFLPVPPDLERDAAPVQYRWIGTRAMGSLNIARLDAGSGTPLLPVDIARWQKSQTDEAMSLLHAASRGSFPIRGYPQPLIRAHEHARMGGLEIALFESLLIEALHERDPATAGLARQHKLQGRQLTSGNSTATEDED